MSLRPGMRVGPYEVLSLLGAGGMGEVYKAQDGRLGRFVALKILPSDKVKDADRKRRLAHEAQAASRLNHPGIVTIYDISEYDGAYLIVMEFVEGTRLDELIAGHGLPFKDALKYAAEIAEAVGKAHSAGIVHRDLKPANIMITEDGRAKVLDFGLAKLIDPILGMSQATTAGANPGASASITVDANYESNFGAIVGTVAYMSPEQAEGKSVDVRSDVFSFGVVLYEMLSGQSAFRRETLISTLAAVLHGEPPPLRELRSDLSPSVERCVTRCLRKDPAQRFQNMADVKAALSDVRLTEASEEEMPSIAVLPFANLTADAQNDYFSDGLAEEILNALAKVPGLRVIARASAFAFRGRGQDLRAIGAKLNVRAILEGSVRRAGNRVRVNTQLIQLADESQLWSEGYDREMTDIFAIQDEISRSIADALKVKLTARRPYATNIEAYHNYLKGLHHHQRYSQDGLENAKKFFDQALIDDPNYAPAYAGLAGHYYTLALLGIKRMRDVAPLAKAAAEKALAIDPTLNDAHSILGVISAVVEYDWKAAERHFARAMAIEPVPPLIRMRGALYCHAWQRRYDKALEEFQRALETDPLSMIVHFGLTLAHYWKRDYESAIRVARRGLEINPNFFFVQLAMGMAKLQAGALPDAITCFEKTLAIAPWYSVAACFLAIAYTRAGRRDQAAELMSHWMARRAVAYVSPSGLGLYYASSGDLVKAFEFLETSFADRDPNLLDFEGEPLVDPFRSHPRYLALLKRMNLASA